MNDEKHKPEGISESQLYSVKDLSHLLRLSKRQIHRLRSCGKLGISTIKLGGSIRFSAKEVSDWIAEGCPSREIWKSRRESENG